MPDVFAPLEQTDPFVGPVWFDKMACWIREHSRAVLCCGILLQLLILVSMIAMHSAPLIFGQRIWLQVVPVDPRDMFRGDFVVLSYDFSRTDTSAIEGAPAEPSWRSGYRQTNAWWEDRTVYVSLEQGPDGKHYRSTRVSVQRPTSGLFLKGRFAPLDGNNLQFGIEAYYVEAGQGAVLEQLRNKSQLSAEIAVTPWGQAGLCTVK